MYSMVGFGYEKRVKYALTQFLCKYDVAFTVKNSEKNLSDRNYLGYGALF